MDTDALIKEQITFYRLLAPDYDQEVENAAWSRLAEAVLRDCPFSNDCLELASGSGLWTKRLLQYARKITAVDTSPELLALSMQRIDCQRVHYIRANIFRFVPEREYDLVFAAFWLSHVPQDRFDSFWKMVASALRPGGHILFVDSYSSGPGGGRAKRRLADGREFNIIKVSHNLQDLENRLGLLGFRASAQPLCDATYRVVGRTLSK